MTTAYENIEAIGGFGGATGYRRPGRDLGDPWSFVEHLRPVVCSRGTDLRSALLVVTCVPGPVPELRWWVLVAIPLQITARYPL
jgi:hypothetical protein